MARLPTSDFIRQTLEAGERVRGPNPRINITPPNLPHNTGGTPFSPERYGERYGNTFQRPYDQPFRTQPNGFSRVPDRLSTPIGGTRQSTTPQKTANRLGAMDGLGLFAGGGLNAIGNIGAAAIAGDAAKVVAQITGDNALKVADKGLEGTKYESDKSLEGTKYNADKNFESNKYNTDRTLDQQYKMWDRDYKIASSLGLYHPSQLMAVGNNTPSSSDVYKLTARGLMCSPRTTSNSPFGF
jgi:hypothetical protein